MILTRKTNLNFRNSFNIPIKKLGLFSPLVCSGCSARESCDDIIVEPPSFCPNSVLHSLLNFSVGYFESERQSGKTREIITVMNYFIQSGRPVLYVVPVLSYADSIRRLVENVRCASLNSADVSLRGLPSHYVFVDEVEPHEMDSIWGLLKAGDHVFVLGFFS